MLIPSRARSVERDHGSDGVHHITPHFAYGWNAGYSEAGGVGRVARYLERQGITDLTIDVVHAHAKSAGASRHLQNAAKVSWCKGVTTLYRLEQRGLDEPDAA